ncbi:PH domain-containing protein [Vibrio gangliei]|uniref:PH domain-containing protein n=1 Tax=Vibrio gangliei TaxID=2077090 RepID=UPI000D021C90|nr:PH domain-containing protein [Vibrio gangliei]
MSKEPKHLKAFKEKHLDSNDTVIAWSEGYIGEMMGKGENTQHNGIFIVTNTKAAFYRKGFLGEILETIPLKQITSIERKSSLGHRIIRLHTSHDDLEFKTFDKEGESEIIQAIEKVRNNSPQPEKTQHNEIDAIEKIKKLGELKELGLLTDSEFEEKKAHILQQI